MNAVQRFEAVMNFKTPDRFPVIEWATYWDQTIRRWYADGLPDNLVEPADIRPSAIGHLAEIDVGQWVADVCPVVGDFMQQLTIKV